LGASEAIVRQKKGLDALYVLGGDAQPRQDGFFFDAFDSMDRREAVSFGEQRQAFKDGLLRMMAPVEDGADRFDEGLATDFALVALGTRLATTESPDVALLDLAVLRALRIPAEGARMHEGVVR
jgi:hypothetical protein